MCAYLYRLVWLLLREHAGESQLSGTFGVSATDQDWVEIWGWSCEETSPPLGRQHGGPVDDPMQAECSLWFTLRISCSGPLGRWLQQSARHLAPLLFRWLGESVGQ